MQAQFTTCHRRASILQGKSVTARFASSTPALILASTGCYLRFLWDPPPTGLTADAIWQVHSEVQPHCQWKQTLNRRWSLVVLEIVLSSCGPFPASAGHLRAGRWLLPQDIQPHGFFLGMGGGGSEQLIARPTWVLLGSLSPFFFAVVKGTDPALLWDYVVLHLVCRVSIFCKGEGVMKWEIFPPPVFCSVGSWVMEWGISGVAKQNWKFSRPLLYVLFHCGLAVG